MSTGKIDEMGVRIDDLEKSIGELMEHAGIDESHAHHGASTSGDAVSNSIKNS